MKALDSNAQLSVVLFNPQIPQNTGNIGRLCAVTGAALHLIHPLGFKIEDRHLRRSGMDYWHSLTIFEHANWEAFCESKDAPKRLWLLSTKATQSFWDVSFAPGDGLLFGNEGAGLPDYIHQQIGPEGSLTIPHADTSLRSLNLATAAGIVLYEALRQL